MYELRERILQECFEDIADSGADKNPSEMIIKSLQILRMALYPYFDSVRELNDFMMEIMKTAIDESYECDRCGVTIEEAGFCDNCFVKTKKSEYIFKNI